MINRPASVCLWLDSDPDLSTARQQSFNQSVHLAMAVLIAGQAESLLQGYNARLRAAFLAILLAAVFVLSMWLVWKVFSPHQITWQALPYLSLRSLATSPAPAPGLDIDLDENSQEGAELFLFPEEQTQRTLWAKAAETEFLQRRLHHLNKVRAEELRACCRLGAHVRNPTAKFSAPKKGR